MNLVGKKVTYKGNDYDVTEIHESRHPETGAWYEVYRYVNTVSGKVYSRKRADFEAKFAEVPS
jgi:hypothetical protein